MPASNGGSEPEVYSLQPRGSDYDPFHPAAGWELPAARYFPRAFFRASSASAGLKPRGPGSPL